MSSNDGNDQKSFVTSYADVASLLLWNYVADAVIGKADEETRTTYESLLAPWDVSHKLKSYLFVGTVRVMKTQSKFC